MSSNTKVRELHHFESGEMDRFCVCGSGLEHRTHYHLFRASGVKTLCLCGYGLDALQHNLSIEDTFESRQHSIKSAADKENREHDAEVILKFKEWLGKLAAPYISKTDLIRLIDGYAQNVKQGRR